MEDLLLFIFLTFLLAASLSVCFIKSSSMPSSSSACTPGHVGNLADAGSPDLAITEAAAGIGVSVIMIAVVTRLGREDQ